MFTIRFISVYHCSLYSNKYSTEVHKSTKNKIAKMNFKLLIVFAIFGIVLLSQQSESKALLKKKLAGKVVALKEIKSKAGLALEAVKEAKLKVAGALAAPFVILKKKVKGKILKKSKLTLIYNIILKHRLIVTISLLIVAIKKAALLLPVLAVKKLKEKKHLKKKLLEEKKEKLGHLHKDDAKFIGGSALGLGGLAGLAGLGGLAGGVAGGLGGLGGDLGLAAGPINAGLGALGLSELTNGGIIEETAAPASFLSSIPIIGNAFTTPKPQPVYQ